MDVNAGPDQELDTAVKAALQLLMSRRCNEGNWAFELEADSTITSEYILLNHFLVQI